ncbi:Cubilin protein [Penaeus vannamei]|uniref:Cubilin protein n=1 Tax=Penaeus vannamei TaxID=6689 RepID=A0A423T849_PENVA|nr:Cubilin protein [Penaeus vannamei]
MHFVISILVHQVGIRKSWINPFIVRFCGTDISAGQVFQSVGGEMILYFKCTIYTENGATYFISPYFPESYPPNAYCALSNITDELATVYLYIRVLRLRPGDVLQIQNPYTPPLTLTGRKNNYRRVIPSAQFLATFTSNSLRQWKGFYAQFRPRTSGCHQILSASPGGAITSPRFPRRYPRKKYCEWHIIAAMGMKVQLTFTHMRWEPTP